MMRVPLGNPSSDRTEAHASGEGANVLTSMPFGITQLFSVLNPNGLCFVWPSRETKIILSGSPERNAHALMTAPVRHFSSASALIEEWMLHNTVASRDGKNVASCTAWQPRYI